MKPDKAAREQSESRILYRKLVIDRAERKHRWNSFIKTVLTIFFAGFLGVVGIYVAVIFHNNDQNDEIRVTQNCTYSNLPDANPLAACSSHIDPAHRFDCWPEGEGATPNKCGLRGCCWQPVYDNHLENVPWCFYHAQQQFYQVTQRDNLPTGIRAHLRRDQPSGWPRDVMSLTVDVTYDTTSQLHFKIYDSQNARYEVPIKLTPASNPVSAGQSDFVVDVPASGPFYLTVTRKTTGEVLFNTKNSGPLIFADQFISIGTSLSTGYNYGLGEHTSKFLLDTNWTVRPFWARDQAPVKNANLYGTHPFYLSIESDFKAHGVFLLNSNAMETELQPAPAVTFRTTGGILDFYVFSGPTPENVVQQYTELIGRPFMPPYWALGFHLCRYGYHNITKFKAVIQRMRNDAFPYDTQWIDIDYMDRFLDWTYDKNKFAGLPEVVQDLHSNGQHFVIIVDPGISNTQPKGTYPPFDEGMAMDVFIKKPDRSGPIIGKVWPGLTAFPDFFHPNATVYWTKQIQDFHRQLPFDGLWTDMNEPSNFVDGSTEECPINDLEDPPFVPKLLTGGKLRAKTLCVSAQQYLSTHYNLHSLYGHSEVVATKKGLDAVLQNKRSIVISRSSYPSTGHHGGHWTGDNWSAWDQTYYSITAMLSFQLFGIPFVGADICGFGGNTTPELCTRWMQLGAFYPFMRNHNSLGSKDQDPGVFDKATKDIMRDALNLRYTLLPYLYTLLYRSHVNGTTVARPLFFQYPKSDYDLTYKVDVQFMWGSALLITPATSVSTTQGEGYLPKDRWYDWFNHSYIDSPGHMITFDLPMEHINLQVRGGSIVPLQEPAVTTTLSRKKPFSLLVALSPGSTADGEMFWDDGISEDSIPSGKYNLIKFSCMGGNLRSSISVGGYTAEPMLLNRVDVMGVASPPAVITINNVPTHNYFYGNQTLTLVDLSLSLLQPFTITWQ